MYTFKKYIADADDDFMMEFSKGRIHDIFGISDVVAMVIHIGFYSKLYMYLRILFKNLYYYFSLNMYHLNVILFQFNENYHLLVLHVLYLACRHHFFSHFKCQKNLDPSINLIFFQSKIFIDRCYSSRINKK